MPRPAAGKRSRPRRTSPAGRAFVYTGRSCRLHRGITPEPRRTLYALLGMTALAALARFATLDLQSFHHDEAVTAGAVLDPSLGATLDQVADGERSPPLYYILAWGWSTLFGTGEVGLRSLSALIGTLMVPAAFFCGRALSSDRVGLAAALSGRAQPLSRLVLARGPLIHPHGALRDDRDLGASPASERREATGARLWIWALASAVALLSHYFAVFLIVPQALWLLRRSPGARRLVLPPIAAVALVGLALVPLALTQQGSDRREGFTDRPVARARCRDRAQLRRERGSRPALGARARSTRCRSARASRAWRWPGHCDVADRLAARVR